MLSPPMPMLSDLDELDGVWKLPPSPPPTSLVVAVSPRRARVLLFSALSVALVVSLTLLFLHGVELERFDAHAKSQDAQTKLVNDYNAYSGTIATVFAKPVEQFVGMAVQLLALRVVAGKLTQSQTSWKLTMIITGAAAVVGFLVGNGLNALNVQLRPQELRPRIVAADLSAAVDAAVVANGSSVVRTLTEMTSKNPTSNTMLRNLVTAAAPRPITQCPWSAMSTNDDGDVADHSLQTGVPRRDWLARVLPEVLTPKTLRLVVNATDPTVNANVRPTDLPMNATLAAEIVLYSLLYGRFLFPLGDDSSFEINLDFIKTYPELQVTQYGERHRMTGPMAEMLGLLPNSTTSKADEAAQREQLLRESVILAARQFDRANVGGVHVALTNVSMEFSHVDISPSVQFDAVTWEFEPLPSTFADAASDDNATFYTNLDMRRNCGQWPGLCLIEKVAFKADNMKTNESTPQVQALSPCVSDDATERMVYDVISTDKRLLHGLKCPRTSNSSMIVLSFAKRLVADAITQDTIRNASGSFPAPDHAVVTNLRKIYAYTVGRLAWKVSNLADANHAACVSPTNPQCLGLQLALNGSKQQLVVGADALPLERFVAMGDSITDRPRYVQLAEVYEPEGSLYELALGGDPLLPHNIGQITWPRTRAMTEASRCNARVEDRLRLVVDNHYYSEHSYQPAYTAATLFLFQNAVVRDAIALENGRTTLRFAASVRRIAVWLSTPKLNAWLTLAGCILLALALLAAVTKSYWSSSNDPLEVITDAHVIARVLVNEEQFPPTLLRRRVVRDDRNPVMTSRTVEDCAISALSLQPVDARDRVRSTVDYE